MADTDGARIGDVKAGFVAAKDDANRRLRRDGSNVDMTPEQAAAFRAAIGAGSGGGGGGSGDVVGPASATADSLVLFSGTTGKVIKGGPALGVGSPGSVPTRADADGRYQSKLGFTPADASTVYTKAQVDSSLANKADLVGGKVPTAQLPAPPTIPTFATVAEVRAGTATGKTIDPATLVDADSYVPVTANGAFTLDFSAGRKFKVTMTANSTMSITGLTKEISGVIRFQQDATGGRTLALNSAIKKVGSYTLSTAANAVDRCGVEICGGVAELTALEKGIA